MKRLLIYLVLALQVIGLVSLYAYYSSDKNLPRYQLRTRPVDPRDLLRGDYVILRYDISELPDIWKPEDFPDGQAYVMLEPDGAFWKIQYVSPYQPSGISTYLRAEVNGRTLTYGIEKYFVPEGQGNPPLPLTVDIVVRDNRANIIQLYANGQPWPPESSAKSSSMR